MNKLKDDEYKRRYENIIESYKQRHKEYNDLLKELIKERKTRTDLISRESFFENVAKYVETVIKLMLSTFLDSPDPDELEKQYGITISNNYRKEWSGKDKNWLNIEMIKVSDSVEILARMLEHHKIKPKFNLQVIFRSRPDRNDGQHNTADSVFFESPRLWNTLREMLIYIDDSQKDRLPKFEYDNSMFNEQEMNFKFNDDDCVKILITDSVQDIDNEKKQFVANLKWKFVVDLDGYSSNGGLFSSVFSMDNISFTTIDKNCFDNRQNIKMSSCTNKNNWYICGSYQIFGSANKNLTIEQKAPFCEYKFFKSFSSLIENVLDQANDFDKQIVVVINVHDNDLLNSIIEKIKDLADDFEYGDIVVNYIGLCLPPQQRPNRFEYHHCFAPVEQLYDFVYHKRSSLKLYSFEKSKTEFLVPIDKEHRISLDNKRTRDYLEEYFDILYYDMRQPDREEKEKHIKDFYHGGTVSWDIIDDTVKIWNDDKIKKIKNDITTALGKESSKKLFFIKHKPGYGGSTLLRQIIWSLHLNYPVFYVKKYNAEIIRNEIINLYDYKLEKTPIILAADDTLCDWQDLCTLVSKDIKRRCCLFLSCRNDVNYESNDIISYWIKDPPDEDELKKLREKFIFECQREGIEKEEIDKRDGNFDESVHGDMCNPFMIGLYYFTEQFNLDSYINKAFYADKLKDSVVACLAMCDIGNEKDVPSSIVRALAEIKSRKNIWEQYNKITNLVCSDEKNNKTFYSFQHYLLSKRYLDEYKRRYYLEDSSENGMYFDLIEKLIRHSSEVEVDKVAVFEFLKNLLIQNKDIAQMDYKNKKISIIVNKMERTNQIRILQYLAETFSKNLDSNISENLSNEQASQKQLVSHTYAHLGRIYEQDNYKKDDAQQCFDKAFKYMLKYDHNIYHMYALSMSSYFHRELDSDEENQYILETERIENELKKIEENYDKTSEYGSPEYGFPTKLLYLYAVYIRYIYKRESIDSFVVCRTFTKEIIKKMEQSFEIIDTYIELDNDMQKKIDNLKYEFRSNFMFRNYGKSIEYYKNMMDEAKGNDDEKWRNAAYGYILSRINLAKTNLSENINKNIYSYIEQKQKRELYEIMQNILHHTDIVQITNYLQRCRISWLYHNWIRLSKELCVNPDKILDNLKDSWKEIEEKRLTKKSTEPFYHLALTYLVRALYDKSLFALDDAKKQFKDNYDNSRNNCFREDQNCAEWKRDILVENRNAMGMLFDISYCKDEGEILHQCVLNNVKPMIVTAKLISVNKGIAKFLTESPKYISGIDVYMKVDKYGNDIRDNSQGDFFQIILCFSYARPTALSKKGLFADVTIGETLNIDTILNQYQKADFENNEKNKSTESLQIKKEISANTNIPDALSSGSQVMFTPKQKYIDYDHSIIYINGKVDGAAAGFNMIEQLGKFSDYTEQTEYYGGADKLADSIIEKGTEISCIIKSTQFKNSSYRCTLQIADTYKNIKDILANENIEEQSTQPLQKNGETSDKTYLKTEVESVPVGTEVNLIIDKSCNDKICGTFKYEGKEYKAKIVQPKSQKKEIKNILKKYYIIQAEIISSSGKEYDLKWIRNK